MHMQRFGLGCLLGSYLFCALPALALPEPVTAPAEDAGGSAHQLAAPKGETIWMLLVHIATNCAAITDGPSGCTAQMQDPANKLK